jgi:hypothetical protein
MVMRRAGRAVWVLITETLAWSFKAIGVIILVSLVGKFIQLGYNQDARRQHDVILSPVSSVDAPMPLSQATTHCGHLRASSTFDIGNGPRMGQSHWIPMFAGMGHMFGRALARRAFAKWS